MRFSIIEGSAAILFTNGQFRQCDMYSREGGIYAKWGVSYVRLYKSGSTSHPKVRWESAEYERAEYDKFGRMCTPGNGVPEENTPPVVLDSAPKTVTKPTLRAVS